MSMLDERVCLITGGAGGIGTAIALGLAHDGGRVVVADLDGESAEQVAQRARDAGGQAIGVHVDVTRRESIRSAISAAVGTFGRLDVLFNNAGISKPMRFLEMSEEEYERIMRVNSLGVMLCSQEAIRQMLEQGGGGKIINTASVAGKEGYPLFSAYCASKFAVVSWTQSVAKEFAEDGITANAFCPGVVTTALWDQLDADMIEIGVTEKPGESLESVSGGILRGRLSTPDDIVGLASFLASPASDYITGQAINVDGGMVLH